jgi:hypothetical protein
MQPFEYVPLLYCCATGEMELKQVGGEFIKSLHREQTRVAHVCNSSYLECRGQEEHNARTTRAKKKQS